MVVTWLTVNSSGTPLVEFGQHRLNRSAAGVETRFEDGGPLKSVRHIQRVVLTGLQPGVGYGGFQLEISLLLLAC